jgi:hypothetical protein
MQPFGRFRTEADIEPRSQNWLYEYMSYIAPGGTPSVLLYGVRSWGEPDMSGWEDLLNRSRMTLTMPIG